MNEALFVISAKALQQPLSSWGQACIVKLLCHAVARLAQDDWREAIEAAQRAYAREQRLNDGRKYASKFLRALREAAKGRIHVIDQNRVAARVEARPMGVLHTLQDHKARTPRPAPVPCPEPAREPVPAPSNAPASPALVKAKRAKSTRAQNVYGEQVRSLTSVEAKHLQALREAGWQWADLAQEVGLSQGALCLIVQGRRNTTPEKLERLLQVSGPRPETDAEGRRYLTPDEITQIKAYPGGLGGLQRATKIQARVIQQVLAGKFRMRPTEIEKLLEVAKERTMEGNNTTQKESLKKELTKKERKDENQGSPASAPVDQGTSQSTQLAPPRTAERKAIGGVHRVSGGDPGEVSKPDRATKGGVEKKAPTCGWNGCKELTSYIEWRGAFDHYCDAHRGELSPSPYPKRQEQTPDHPYLIAQKKREARSLYWQAVADRDEKEIERQARACREMGLTEVLEETKAQLERIEEEVLREPRRIAVQAWEGSR